MTNIMKSLEQLKTELKKSLEYCTYTNDGSLAAHVNENIQWAWDNWDFDFKDYTDKDEKPEGYTPKFKNEWIDNDPFENEL